MSKMKLVLHIGTEKTGTTLLQSWLYRNQERLGRQGVFLSDRIGKPNNRELVSFFRRAHDDFWFRYGFRTEEDKNRFFAGFLENFESELEAAARTHHTAVVSSEHFHSRLTVLSEVDAFAEFCRRNFSEVRVLCYLRPQWEVRKSLYSTALRTSSTKAFPDFQTDLTADNPYYNYLMLYNRWARAFGRESLDFRIYDRSAFLEGDIRRDFLTAVGSCDPAALDYSLDSANERVARLMGSALIGVNKVVPLFAGERVDKRNAYFASLIYPVALLDRGEIFDDLAPQLAETFRESNNALARLAFGRETLFPDPAGGAPPPEFLSMDEVSQIIETLVEALVRGSANRLLLRDDGDVLRDAAMTLESGKALGREQAYALMSLAARARPKDASIRKKLEEWSPSS